MDIILTFTAAPPALLLKANTLGGFEKQPTKTRKIIAPKDWWETELKDIYMEALTTKHQSSPVTANPFLSSLNNNRNFLVNVEQDAANFYHNWFATKLVPLYDKWKTTTNSDDALKLEEEVEKAYRNISAIVNREMMSARLMQNTVTIENLQNERNRYKFFFELSMVLWALGAALTAYIVQ